MEVRGFCTLRWGVLEQTFLSEVKIGTLGTFEQSPYLLHSYKNITGTLQEKLEHYHARMVLFTRGTKNFLCAWANALKQR